MRLKTALIMLAICFSLSAAKPPEGQATNYRVKTYDDNCRLLAAGELNLSVAAPDEDGIRRINGSRIFEPHVDDAYPFRSIRRELIGRIEGDAIHLNLDRSVFDSNTHVRGKMIESPEPGFEGTWQHSGWGLGPSGRIIGARAPAEPTKPCEELPQPVTADEIQDQMSELIRSMEDGMRPLRKREQDRRSAPAQDDERDGNEDEKDGGSQNF